MRIITRKTLRDFWRRYPDSEQPLKAWFAEARSTTWKSPQTIKRHYRHASFLADNRVIFNIAGNKDRLEVHLNYKFQIAYIKFIGTHAEYDRVDPENI